MRRARILLLALAIFGVGFDSFAAAGKNSPLPGDAPPPLLLGEVIRGPAAGSISWEKLRSNVVVMEFWDTRCGPCREAIPHWNGLATQFASKPVVFLSISDDNKDDLEIFLKRTPIKGWVALDQPFSPTRGSFDVVAIPHTILVDAKGRIAAITHPATVQASNIDEILNGKATTLPAFVPYTNASASISVSNIAPARVEVSIVGPFEVPVGMFNRLGWRKPDYQFVAEKAYLPDALSYFFDVSPFLVSKSGELPKGLYNISAAAPFAKLPELKTAVIAEMRSKFALSVVTNLLNVEVYRLTVAFSNAPGFRPAEKGGGGGDRSGGFYLDGSPMKAVARFLASALNKPVVDETGSTGLWKVDFNWPMSEAEKLEERLRPQFGDLFDTPSDKIDLARLRSDAGTNFSHEDLTFLKAELAKPVEQ